MIDEGRRIPNPPRYANPPHSAGKIPGNGSDMALKCTTDDKLEALRRFYRINRRLPTYSEICRIFGYNSKNAAFRLASKLVEEGYIEKDDSGRLIPIKGRFGLPLVGYVQAGFPTPAEEELIDTLSLDEYLIDNPDTSFLLKVSGDSMIEAGIFDGDMVIIDRSMRAKNGDIVLACVDDEWTLKYLRSASGVYELVPANPKYPVIKPHGELTVGGIVKAVIRRYQ